MTYSQEKKDFKNAKLRHYNAKYISELSAKSRMFFTPVFCPRTPCLFLAKSFTCRKYFAR